MRTMLKNKRLAAIGLVWMVLAVMFQFATQSTADIWQFLLQLNIILLPSWGLFLFALDLSRKSRWRYKR